MAKNDGYGAAVQYDNAGDGTWVNIGQLRDIDGPELLSEALEASTHDDSTSNHKDYIAGMQDLGDLSSELVYDPALASHVWLAGDARTAFRNIRFIFPDAGSTTWTFSGMCSSVSPKAPIGGLLSADFTMKCKGPIVVS